MAANGTSRRGFASMSLERRREIASKGGLSVPADKRSFSQNRTLASKAGQKGGQAVPAEHRAFNDRDLASRAGKIGGASPRSKGAQ